MGTLKGSQFPWTDEAIAELKRLHAGALFSCSEIATRLADEFRQACSRNSVIGKLLRLGLSNQRATGPKPKVRKVRPVRHDRFRPAKIAAPVVEPMPDIVDDQIPLEQRRTLDQLTNVTCRWPVGTPGESDFYFCGAETADLLAGQPYCPGHTKRAHQPGRAPNRYAWGRGRE
jgi:GcrA cell cycle regulator